VLEEDIDEGRPPGDAHREQQVTGGLREGHIAEVAGQGSE
jgi:hypothetical protein